jgi:hypothetical protein
MITLSPDEVALLKSILTRLRAIKVREIDQALVILSQGDRIIERGDCNNKEGT